MFHVLDPSEIAFACEASQSTSYCLEHNDVNLDEVIRLEESLQTVDDSDYPDFWEPL